MSGPKAQEFFAREGFTGQLGHGLIADHEVERSGGGPECLKRGLLRYRSMTLTR